MDTKKTIANLKKRLGNLEGDRQYLASLLFDAVESYGQAQENVKANGQTIRTNQRIFVNPCVNIMADNHKQIVKLLALLGVSATDGDDAFELPK